MLEVMTLMYRVLFSPVWLLWKLYNGLWWAFDDSEAVVTSSVRAESRGAAFEVVDSRPKPVAAPRPTGALRGGFIGSIAACGGFGLITHNASHAHWITEQTGIGLWIWASVVTFVGSLFAVRRVARAQAQRAARKRGVAAAVAAVRDAAQCAVANAGKATVMAAGSRVGTKVGPVFRACRGGAQRACRAAGNAAKAGWAGLAEAAKTWNGKAAGPSPSAAGETRAAV